MMTRHDDLSDSAPLIVGEIDDGARSPLYTLRIYAMIDAADDSGSDRVSYELTVDDLGEEDAEGDRELRSWLADREASR